MAYPNKEEILKVMSEIEKKHKKGKLKTLKVLSKDATTTDRWKFKISQKLAEFKSIKQLSLEEMAKLLKTDKANLSRILNGHLQKTSLEKLYSYLSMVVIASKDKHLASLFNKKADQFFEFDELKFG